jgi:TonB family protein
MVASRLFSIIRHRSCRSDPSEAIDARRAGYDRWPLLVSAILHLSIVLLFFGFDTGQRSRETTFQAMVVFDAPPRSTPTVPPGNQNKTSAPRRVQNPPKTVDSSPPVSRYRFVDPESPSTAELPIIPDNVSDPALKRYIQMPQASPGERHEIIGALPPLKRDLPEPAVASNSRTAALQSRPLSGSVENIDSGKNPAVNGKIEDQRPTARTDTVSKPDPEEVSTVDRRPAVGDARTSGRSIWQQRNELLAYRAVLARLITANWLIPPVEVSSFQVMMEAQIDRRGNPVRIRLLQSSGLAILDAAAEKAIRISAPFPPLPSTFDPEMEVFRVVFRFTPDRVIE